MQRFSVFHFLLCLGLVAGQEPCTVESKRSANTSKYSDVLRCSAFLLHMDTASISCWSSRECRSRVAGLTLTTTGLQAKEVRLHQKRNGGWSQGKPGSHYFDWTHCIVLLRKCQAAEWVWQGELRNDPNSSIYASAWGFIGFHVALLKCSC